MWLDLYIIIIVLIIYLIKFDSNIDDNKNKTSASNGINFLIVSYGSLMQGGKEYMLKGEGS